MGTLIVSDLHLGARTGTDVLRRPRPRDALLRAVEGTRRLVLLGDLLELRQAPVGSVLATVRGFFGELADALGDAEVVIVPGNHDHALLSGWVAQRTRAGPAPPLALEQRIEPGQASWVAQAVAGWLGTERVSMAYPGVWLREDVYATHGHYLDCHGTVPTFERLGAGAMARLLGPLPDHGATPEDYERLLAPIYAWIHAVAQGARDDERVASGGSAAVWRTLAGEGQRPLRARLLAGILPVGIGALNRAGLGPVRADLSPQELRRAGIRAMAAAAAALRVPARHVIFGHTHRAGPLAEDDRHEWATHPGPDERIDLLNTGCWVYQRRFLAPGPASPFWPGGAAVLHDTGPPQLRFLLRDCSAGELTG